LPLNQQRFRIETIVWSFILHLFEASPGSKTPIAGRLFPDEVNQLIGIFAGSLWSVSMTCTGPLQKVMFMKDGQPKEGEL